MSLNRAFEIGASALSAQRTRMETIASNLANVQTTRTPEGGPYRRMMPVFSSELIETEPTEKLDGILRAVRVVEIARDGSEGIRRHEPGHPDADAEGYVTYPNVTPTKEMLDMLSAARSYEANVTLVSGIRNMLRATLDIIG